jgi:C_GCAxxG_C_C family probable redox protein
MQKGRGEEAYERAGSYLLKGFNCAQSVLLTMQEILGYPDELVLKAATGFGGGIGNMGSLCGALSGGVMALGLKYGRYRLEQKAEKEKTYLLCAEWFERFKRRFGSALCIEILKADLKDPVKRMEYWGVEANRLRCANETVGTAAELLMELIEETEREKEISG